MYDIFLALPRDSNPVFAVRGRFRNSRHHATTDPWPSTQSSAATCTSTRPSESGSASFALLMRPPQRRFTLDVNFWAVFPAPTRPLRSGSLLAARPCLAHQNEARTSCYHFATQLGSTGRYGPEQGRTI